MMSLVTGTMLGAFIYCLMFSRQADRAYALSMGIDLGNEPLTPEKMKEQEKIESI